MVCVNLMDEAKRKGISIDLPALEAALGMPVVGMTARKKRELARLPAALDAAFAAGAHPTAPLLRYPAPIEAALDILTPALPAEGEHAPSPRWLALRLLCGDTLPGGLSRDAPGIGDALAKASAALADAGIDRKMLTDLLVETLVGRPSHQPHRGPHRPAILSPGSTPRPNSDQPRHRLPGYAGPACPHFLADH